MLRKFVVGSIPVFVGLLLWQSYKDVGPFSVLSLKESYGKTKLTGKTAIVVGGTSGIGRGIAMRLAQADVSVIIVGRNEDSGQEAVQEMQTLAKSKDSHFSFVKCDVQELRNVKDFVAKFNEGHSTLDFLVLSQGIATIQGRTETKEGLDQKMSLHYYSRMEFISQLLPALEKAESSRVLSVLSGGVHGVYSKYAEDPELRENYSLQNAANAAGFYNDLGLDSFSKEHPKVAFIHSGPGFVNTNWGTELPTLLRGMVRLLQPLGKSPQDCAEFMCEALFDPELKPGFHLRGSSGQSVNVTKDHEQARDTVWKHTKDVLARIE